MFFGLDLIRQYQNLIKLNCLLEERHQYSKEQSREIARLKKENRRLRKQVKSLKSDLSK